MSKNANDNIDKKLLAYLRDELPEEEIAELRQQLDENELYINRLERLMFEEVAEQEHKETTGLDETKKQQILRKSKWKSRFSNAGFTTLFIIGVLIGGFVLVQPFNMLWFHFKTDSFQKVATDVVQFTQPGTFVDGGGTSGSFTFSFDNKIKLGQLIGKQTQSVGSLNSHVNLFGSNSQTEWNNGQLTGNLSFRVPGPHNHNQADQDMKFAAWRKLEMLPEGTVSQMAISFDRYLSFDEYFQMIDSTYDVQTTWLAVDTGQEPDLAQNNFAKTYWGFFPRQVGYFGSMQAEGEGKKFEKAYLEEMKYLVGHEELANKIARGVGVRTGTDGKLLLRERYEYLQKNGVRIYGAVVTGPTKDLLKMKKETAIQGPVVGGVDWWNWDRVPGPGRGSW